MNHPHELEDYLRVATRGLWGKRKLEVREELEAHVLERAYKHELLGLAREDAISISIQELGNARVINFHMMEVYMISKQLLLGGFCACVLASFGIWQITNTTVLRLECSNADQTFHFSGTTTGTYSRLNLPDKSVFATAIKNSSFTAENINTTFSEDLSGITSMQSHLHLASFETPGHIFGFSDVEMKTVTRNGKTNPEVRCEFK
jgi:hypothetical protein